MSILLESLNQSQPENNKNVPSIEDSHFDDEMMSDEWLLAKIKFWQRLCVFFMVALFVSWLIFLLMPLTQGQKTETAQTNNMEVISSDKTNLSPSEGDESVIVEKQATKDMIQNKGKDEGQSITKQTYQPQKKVVVVSDDRNQQSSTQANNKPERNANVANSTNKDANFEFGQTNNILEYNGLSTEQKNTLPVLEISSYAVSSNPNKSFVVLNGSFYGAGEVIAPHLTLVSINKENIIVNYKGQLISKKYSL
jgi:hypothetical protein